VQEIPHRVRRGGGHNVGVDEHRIVNENFGVDKVVTVDDGGANNMLHEACSSFLAVSVVAAATSSVSTSSSLSTTVAPTT